MEKIAEYKKDCDARIASELNKMCKDELCEGNKINPVDIAWMRAALWGLSYHDIHVPEIEDDKDFMFDIERLRNCLDSGEISWQTGRDGNIWCICVYENGGRDDDESASRFDDQGNLHSLIGCLDEQREKIENLFW